MRALVTGATGFIGRALVAKLDRPIVLTRDPNAAGERFAEPGGVALKRWSLLEGPPPAGVFAGIDAVFHLAGEPVAAGRWNDARKARIRDSRVQGTRALVDAIAALDAKPKVLVSASAVGFYGSRGDEVVDEASAPGDDFLASVCVAWEKEAARAREHGLRVASVRFGVVLHKDGGALSRMLLPFKLCLGGRLGSGRQWMPWIHRDDAVGILLHAAENEGVSGPINAVGPEPVTNLEFTQTLASVLGRPAIFPVFRPMVSLAFGEMGTALFLSSQRVAPRVAERTGYRFRHATLAEALRAAV